MDNLSRIFEKLKIAVNELKSSIDNISFKDICNTVKLFGFQQRAGKGSHVIFSRKDIYQMLNFQDVKGKAKPYQIRQFIKLIDKYKLMERL